MLYEVFNCGGFERFTPVLPCPTTHPLPPSRRLSSACVHCVFLFPQHRSNLRIIGCCQLSKKKNQLCFHHRNRWYTVKTNSPHDSFPSEEMIVWTLGPARSPQSWQHSDEQVASMLCLQLDPYIFRKFRFSRSCKHKSSFFFRLEQLSGRSI